MTRLPAVRASVFLLVVVMLLPSCSGAQGRRTSDPVSGKTAARPPEPPASGPGGTAYAHARVVKNMRGEGALAYWIFEPAEPVPSSAPVVLFLHGWRGTDPESYGGWIEHLVRRGSIVIYPVFEKSRSDSTDEILAAALRGSKDGIDHARRSGRADLNRFAIVGHSLGGGLTAQIAARAQEIGLPAPQAIMPTQPGWQGGGTYPTEALPRIPAGVLMFVVVGSQDQFASTRHDRPIWEGTTQIPADRKRYIIVQGDDHGSPPLLADHSSPLAYRDDYGLGHSARDQRRMEFVRSLTGMRENRANALNFWGYWRLFDALTDAAWVGKTIDAALTAARPTARWSDGTPMKVFVDSAGP